MLFRISRPNFNKVPNFFAFVGSLGAFWAALLSISCQFLKNYRHFPGQTNKNPNHMRINLPWLLHLPDNCTVRDYSFARRFVRSTLNPPAHPQRMGWGVWNSLPFLRNTLPEA